MADLGYFLQNPVRKIRETLPRYAARDTARLPEGCYVSLCFDDFPKSAVSTAKPELDRRGWAATWYASGGLMAQDHPVYGRMFDAGDLAALQRDGHDIGCHTYNHLDCLAASDNDVIAELALNRNFFASHDLPGAASFAYPYGSLDLSAKQILMKRLPAMRGVRPGIHQGTADLGLLMATGIEDHNGGTCRALAQLEQMTGTASWLIIFTHDVCETPSPWGCTPDDLNQLLDAIAATGANVLSVAQMLALIEARRDSAGTA